VAEDTRSGAAAPVVSGADIRTFLFADMRGYTRFTQEHGDDAASALAGRFADVVKETVPEYEGELLELRGDEALCVFRSARQALRASVALQRRLRTGTDDEPAFPIGVGMGLDAGEAVPTHGGYRGASLNLAARLCGLARPGEILASETVIGLSSRVDGMRFLERRSAPLKGMARPVRYVAVEPEQPLPPAPVPVGMERRRVTPVRVAVLVGVGAVVVAGALLAGTLGGQGPSAALAANAVGSLSASGAVSAQVVLPRGGRPGGIAAGAGAVWATDAVNGSLFEIDPSSGVIVDTVPNAGVVPAGVAVGGGGVWVADSGGARVRWFNASAPGTGTSIAVGQGPGPIAYGLGAAWVVNTIDGTLQRISRGLKPSPSVSIGVSPTAVTIGAGSVWVADSASNSVVRVSPTGQVTDRISVGNDPVGLAFGGGDVWVANGADGTVTRIDPATDAHPAVTVGGQPNGVTFTSGSVWVTLAEPNRIARIAPSSLAVTETSLGSPPEAVTHLGTQLWITSFASPASHRGGTLRVLFGKTNTGSLFAPTYTPFDPGAARYAVHFSLLHMTNDGLVALRPASGAAGSQVVPDLAVAMPVISDGGMTYTFRLRRGIFYSNGQPVRASDFRFAIERQFLNPISYGWSFFTDIRGAAVCQTNHRRCRAALDAGIVPNDHAGTITIHITHPDGGFIYTLATTFADLLPPIGTPPIDSGKPVPATGPYMITQASANHITLVRNGHFHVWSVTAQPAGFPNAMRWTYEPDPGRALTQVEHGQADVMTDNPPATRGAELRTTYATLNHPNVLLATTYVAFNTRVAPFSNVLARRAVNFAIDRRHVASLQGGSQASTPTCQVLPPAMFGYRPYCPYTTSPNPASGAWHAPNLTRARALVRASGTHGDTVDLRTWAGQVSQPETQYIADLLTQLGYKVNTRTFPNTSAGYNAYGHATTNPRLPLVVIEGWIADYPYPTDFFDPLLVCGTGTEPGVQFCDPHLDSLVRTAEAASGTAAIQAWQRADQAATDQAPWAPLTNQTGTDVISKRVGNYQRNPQFGEILDQLWVK
jgi:peptide/nickel transport system substrate-binding protein